MASGERCSDMEWYRDLALTATRIIATLYVMRTYRPITGPFTFVIAILVVVSGCDSSDPSSSAGGDSSGVPDVLETAYRGFSLSPRGFPEDFSQIGAFFDEVQALGRAGVQANMLWRDDVIGGTDAGEVPEVAQVVTAQDELRDVTLSIVFGWRSGEEVRLAVPGNPANDWSNTEAISRFADMAASFARDNEVEFLFLGNETDFHAEQNPQDYQRWTAAYRTIRQEIKLRSPDTLVGTVFNAEHMMGTGAFSGWTTPVFDAWSLHDASTIDVVGLTVYPYLGTQRPDDLSADYLAPLFELFGPKPIVVTETGWPADGGGLPTAWETGEQQQLDFLPRLTAMLAGQDVRAVNWLFLYPLAGVVPAEIRRTFQSVSARREDGEKRLMYDAWAEFAAQREVQQ